eukprot:CAMPEP_0178404362 /NCGR_PEP_ID=MMETSP0689_2-20121128/17843_1 /TAXON_ID=160604 /ORGANISM="Amphidinium massartii, Strain CS-259" /LENGTH=721 /DNA_ID=CAMNT_0020025341 /DNA_START=132 /DNA_END=2295 /DNA_ORIENTATION=+
MYGGAADFAEETAQSEASIGDRRCAEMSPLPPEPVLSPPGGHLSRTESAPPLFHSTAASVTSAPAVLLPAGSSGPSSAGPGRTVSAPNDTSPPAAAREQESNGFSNVSRPGSARPPMPRRPASARRQGPRISKVASASGQRSLSTARNHMASVAPEAASPEPQSSRAALRSVTVGKLSVHGSIWMTVCSYLSVPALPSFRRASLCCSRVVAKRLAADPSLASALSSYLELRRMKSKRVWVIVRARPATDISCISIDGKRVSVSNTNSSASFFFDRAFGGSATQEEVSNYVGSQLLHHALNGEHLCILAYGQTGSGKTHTMFGSGDGGPNGLGVAFRMMNSLAAMLRQRATAATVELSFLEVYNDQLYDLLDGQRQLPRQRSSEKHVVPQGLTRRQCEMSQMEAQVHSWLREGAATRMVGKTVFNPRSSRSHAVVMLHLCWGQDARGGGRGRETRVYLVDLAGSERAGLYALSQEQLKEGEHINLSLSALGRVVSALASGKCEHVPYRDSALTWLLKDAITGSSARVCMVAAVHPDHPAETASTLRYAWQQYSTLQANSNTRASELASEVRSLQRKCDHQRHAFEKALASDEYGLAWTRESLRGTVHCQPKCDIKGIFEAHPYLSWTQAHQSKAAVRGQRRDRSAIGYIKTIVATPPARDPEDKPDGRIPVIAGRYPGGTTSDRCTEVVFEGRHGRPPVILWYPESALEMVQPPKPLLDALT